MASPGVPLLTGLQHAHKYLGYLTFLLTIGGVVLALAGAGKDAGKAALLHKLHGIGFMNSGRLNVVLGLAVVFMKFGVAGAFASWGWWVGLVVWGGIEPIGKRFVQQELAGVQAGTNAASKLLIGTIIEVVLLTAIVGIMTMSRLGKI